MPNYLLLSRDEKLGISYFYNIDNGYLYPFETSISKGTSAKRFNWKVIIGLILFIIIANYTTTSIESGISYVIAAILGTLIGIVLTVISILGMKERFEKADQIKKTTVDAAKVLVKQNKKYLKKYIQFLVVGTLLSIMSTIILTFDMKNDFLLICVFGFFCVLSFMIGILRPINQIKFRNSLKKDKLL